jgi:hypothetical protein
MIYRTRLKELMCLCFIAVEVYKGRSEVSKELYSSPSARALRTADASGESCALHSFIITFG